MIEKTKANKAGECVVYVEVSVTTDGRKKTVRIPTPIKVDAKSWSAKTQSIIRNKSKDYYKLNQMLLDQKDLVNEIIAELQAKGRFELAEIKQQYKLKTAPITYSFFEALDQFIEEREKKMTHNGVKDFKTLRTHMLNFQDQRKEKIILTEIGNSFFEKFHIYLSDVKIQKSKDDEGNPIMQNLADSTIKKNLRMLRVYLNALATNGLPVNPSYKKYRIQSEEHAQLITLEESEYRLLLNKVSNERLEKVRKLFVLQCATGLRFGDAVKIRKSHVRNDTIFMNAEKTRQKLQIPLNTNSKEILESCNYDTSKIAMSNQKYNDYIKELCKLVGIDKEITKTTYRGNKEVQEDFKKYEIMSSHHGRRFFITQSLINGVRPEVIMSMSGHVDFRSFKKYIALTDEARTNAMSIWSQKFS